LERDRGEVGVGLCTGRFSWRATETTPGGTYRNEDTFTTGGSRARERTHPPPRPAKSHHRPFPGVRPPAARRTTDLQSIVLRGYGGLGAPLVPVVVPGDVISIAWRGLSRPHDAHAHCTHTHEGHELRALVADMATIESAREFPGLPDADMVREQRAAYASRDGPAIQF
jgi:hypothetical protein